MYYLIVWDKYLASIGQEGCLDKVEIPLGVAHFFFELDTEEFPILSSLSLVDYDMFSGAQIDLLVGELFAVVSINSLASEIVKNMVDLMFKARSMEKHVLFDPFRAN